jgi:hypothetical protein
MWECTIVLEKCCVCKTSYRNDVVLQLLLVPVFLVPSTTIGPIKHLIVNLKQHGAYHRMEWHLPDSMWVSRGPESRVLLVHEPIEVEMDFIAKPLAA